MTRQCLTLTGGHPGGVWHCAACRSELSDGVIAHTDDCRWVAGIRDAERAACIALATGCNARYRVETPGRVDYLPFADLLGGTPAATPGTAGAPAPAVTVKVRDGLV